MERELIEALASLKGGKKKLREMVEVVAARLGETEREYAKLTTDRDLVHQRMLELEEQKDLIERLSAREEAQKENSVGE